MNFLMKGLIVSGSCVCICVVVIMATMTIYIVKQAKWESNLKRYRIKGSNVVDPQGFEITEPSHLLKQLRGIEERITNG